MTGRDAYAEVAQCQSFHWATDTDGSEKAAILLPVEVNGRNRLLQLDTGSDVNVLYGTGFYGAGTGEDKRLLPLRIGATSLGQQAFHARPDVAPGQADGVLGLPALLKQIVTLDYRNQLLCFHQHAVIVDDDYFFVPARLKGGKLFLFTGIDKDYHWHYFLDTGASLYNLVIDEVDWQRFTRKSGRESDNAILHGTSWGEPITTVGARVDGFLALGALHLETPEVHFIREKSALFANYPIPARGLIGNAPFMQQRILLDLRPGNIRLGIDKQALRSSGGQLRYSNP